MEKYTFTYKYQMAENGKRYHLLTSNEYPWMNVQVIEIPEGEGEYEKLMKLMDEKEEFVTVAPDRRDFICIQAGGGTPEHPTIEITDENIDEVDEALTSCQQEAALYWAERGEKLKSNKNV